MDIIKDIPETGDIRALVGTYIKNVIYSETGEKFQCCTYGSVRREIEGKSGVFNLRYEKNINDWIVFQWIIDENLLAGKGLSEHR